MSSCSKACGPDQGVQPATYLWAQQYGIRITVLAELPARHDQCQRSRHPPHSCFQTHAAACAAPWGPSACTALHMPCLCPTPVLQLPWRHSTCHTWQRWKVLSPQPSLPTRSRDGASPASWSSALSTPWRTTWRLPSCWEVLHAEVAQPCVGLLGSLPGNPASAQQSLHTASVMMHSLSWVRWGCCVCWLLGRRLRQVVQTERGSPAL